MGVDSNDSHNGDTDYYAQTLSDDKPTISGVYRTVKQHNRIKRGGNGHCLLNYTRALPLNLTQGFNDGGWFHALFVVRISLHGTHGTVSIDHESARNRRRFPDQRGWWDQRG